MALEKGDTFGLGMLTAVLFFALAFLLHFSANADIDRRTLCARAFAKATASDSLAVYKAVPNCR